MKFVDEFRDPKLAKKLLDGIKGLTPDREINLMEVCGTHTVAIFKHGIKELLPKRVKLLSGPGCPVCVTPGETIDRAIAFTILKAREEGIKNFFIISAHKLIPPAMRAILEAKEINLAGFISPGHVSTIIGARPYGFISKEFGVPCVIAGFEPLDVLQSIYMLLLQIREERPRVEIQYRRCVKPEGNIKAQEELDKVFEVSDSSWRGLGTIPDSGLRLRKEFRSFDAEKAFDVQIKSSPEPKGCLCGEILRGVRIPVECSLFVKECTPEHPIGPCMVSSEGTCATYYKYHRRKDYEKG